MKKKVLTIAAILCMAFSAPVSVLADGEPEQVDLEVAIDDPTTQHGGPEKAPPRIPISQIPVVFLDGYTLYFGEPCSGCTLQLVDENEEVVYSVALPNGTAEWELPEALTGKFKLKIILGRYCFFGWIEL